VQGEVQPLSCCPGRVQSPRRPSPGATLCPRACDKAQVPDTDRLFEFRVQRDTLNTGAAIRKLRVAAERDCPRFCRKQLSLRNSRALSP